MTTTTTTTTPRWLKTRTLSMTLFLAIPGFAGCGGERLEVGDGETGGSAGTASGGSSGSASAGAGGSGGSGGSVSAGAGGSGGSDWSSPPGNCDEIAGRWLLFDSDQGKLARRVYAIRGDGTDLRELLPQHDGLYSQPAVSPDGTMLAHVDSATTYVHDVVSGDVVLSFPGDQPAWAPDGSELAFHRDNGTWLVSLESEEERELISCDSCSFGGYQNPVFTHDATALVVDRENQITNVDIGTGAERDIVMNWTLTMGHPTISPDGLWVASTINCASDGDYRDSVWISQYTDLVVPCEGRLVTRGEPEAMNPAWGPGAWIAYERGAEGTLHQVYVVNAETGDECPVATAFDSRNPSWAPEGFNPPE